MHKESLYTRKIPRREALLNLGLLASLGSSAFLPNGLAHAQQTINSKPPNEGFSEVLPAYLKEEKYQKLSVEKIERIFGIKLLSEKLPWDEARLERLRSSLVNLPAHFYAPKKGRPLSIVLSYQDCFCDWNDDEDINRVFLSYARINIENPQLVFRVIAHELTHVLMPMTIRSFGRTIEMTSSWADKIYEIFGQGSFRHPPKFLNDKLSELMQNLNVKTEGKILTPEEVLKKEFYDRFNYGLNWLFPLEFIAILSEYYVIGYDQFLGFYSEFLSDKQLSMIDDFVKNEIFKGRSPYIHAPI